MLINYIGSKSTLVRYFNEYFPQNIKVFVDVFSGSGSVILNKQVQYDIEVINDIDDDIE